MSAAGKPTFCPYPAHTASPVTELDPKLNTIRRLRLAPRPPSPSRSRIALHSMRFLCTVSLVAAAYGPRSRSKSSISGRGFPTTAAVTRTPLFPFRILPLHTLPSSYCMYIHLPNVLSTAFAVDTFHSSAVPVHAYLSILRKSHALPPFTRREKITPDSPRQISIFRPLIVYTFRRSAICAW